jgi:hypothetical protein
VVADRPALVSPPDPQAVVADSRAVVKALPMDTEASQPVMHRTRRARDRAKASAKVSRATPMRPPGRSAATMTRPNHAHTCRRASRRQACLQAAVATAAVAAAAAVAAVVVAIAAAVEAAAIAAAARAAVVAATAIERHRP